MRVKLFGTFLSILFFTSSYADLKKCYKEGTNKDYENVVEDCKPYFKKDARATSLFVEATMQLDQDDKLALEGATWAIDYYDKKGVPTSIEGQKSYAYLVYLIGELYYFGADELKVDQPKGFKYIKRAGNLGYAVAQNQLGNLYVRSVKNPNINFAEAYKWYKLAVANGNLDAKKSFLLKNEKSFIEQHPHCVSLGRTLIGDAYLLGKGGLSKSTEKAIEWYDKAYKVERIAPIELGLAKAYIAEGKTKQAYKYTKDAITEPYAPAFVLMSQLSENKIEKYAYLTVAVSLFESPNIEYWGEFNKYCLPDLSRDGINEAKKQLKALALTPSEQKQADKLIESIQDNLGDTITPN